MAGSAFMAAVPVLMIGVPSGVSRTIPLLGYGRAVSHLAERPEGGAEFFGKQLRLLPGGEVAAPVGLVEVDEVGVELLGPAARGPEDLTGEHREADRELDLRGRMSGRKGCGSSAFPVRAGGGGPGTRQPVQRDVVK